MQEERLRRALQTFLVVWAIVGILVILFVAWRLLSAPLRLVVPPLVFAGVIVYVLNPFVRWLERRGVHRIIGAILAYLLLAAGLVAGGFVFGPPLASQAAELGEELPELAANLQRFLEDRAAALGIDLELLDPQSPQFREAIQEILAGGTEAIVAILAGAATAARAVLQVVITLILGPVLAFYLLIDLPRIAQGLQRLLPPASRGEVAAVGRRIGGAVGSYFRGQLLIATFVGVATAVGFRLIDLPFWALIGTFTGVANLVPLVGPFVGGALGVLSALLAGDGLPQALLVVVVMVIVQRVDADILSPWIVARSVRVSPLTVLIALFIAGSMFGIFGMLVVIPTVAAAKLVLIHLFNTRVPWGGEIPIGFSTGEQAAASPEP